MADDKRPYHERYRPAPPPDYMRYLTAPFAGYWDRQGKLAREGLAMAEDGARRTRGGDMSGYLGAVLGPLNYLTSPINALLPEERATRDFGQSVGGDIGETLAASGLSLAAIAMPGPDVGKAAGVADDVLEAAARKQARSFKKDAGSPEAAITSLEEYMKTDHPTVRKNLAVYQRALEMLRGKQSLALTKDEIAAARADAKAAAAEGAVDRLGDE